MGFLQTNKKWTYPVLAFLAITPFTPWLDLKISHYFYSISKDSVEHFVSNRFVDFIFDYGPLLGNAVAIVSCILLLSTYLFKKLKPWKNPALVLLLTYALGVGLITNGIFKEYWGRARPKQVEDFGGSATFQPYYIPHFHAEMPQKSFPCGHCTTGFYFFSLALVGKRIQKPFLFYLGLALAFGLGILLSITRIAQGGHFFSDTLVSALIMWYVSLAVDWLVYSGEDFS